MRAVRVISASLMLLFLSGPGVGQTQRQEIEAIVEEFLARNPEKLEPIIRNYLVKHPEVLREAIAELIKRRSAVNADASAAIKANAQTLFHSRRHVVLGNAQGDVTMVEFFDYNCGFCKRALADKLGLIASDPRLRIVLKELPVLGPGSVEAARVSIAARMQDPGSAKFLEFHRRLLGERGPVNKERALAVAHEVGLDSSRLLDDLGSEEVAATLDESVKLAQSLGFNGTPSYVIGDSLIRGAVGAAVLSRSIRAARQ